ncbi:MAG: DEAD/DEAH box helicase [Peptostreptococcaceae bacterium]|nr:DEAD/DEAH box helicase [Peptostreptococcaceae bacterium]
MNFKELKIEKKYLEALRKMYIYEPTEVQRSSIPIIFSKKNTIVRAQTGTGKTLAFLLPILSMIDENDPHIQAMILTPTRELADQIVKVGKRLTKDTGVSIVSVFGGHRIHHQIDKMRSNAHIIVGTPGRILDHSRRGTINLKYLKQVVIDEADQMIVYGFLEDIYLIRSRVPEGQQMLLFSATMPENIQKLISDMIPNSRYIELNSDELIVPAIKQIVLLTTEERRVDTLLYSMSIYDPFISIIFAGSKERAKQLYEELVRRGVGSIELLHGDLSQSKRERVLKDFRKMKIQYLVSTDISARGIDVTGITHIFNFDVPKDVEYYVHRIGRTGRMGEDGYAITLMDESENRYIEKIERYAKIKLQKVYDRNEYERSRIDAEGLKNFEIKEKKKFKSRSVGAKKGMLGKRTGKKR